MPIFEYVCKSCENRFEKIVYGAAKVKCPTCESAKVEKQLSVFAASVGNGSSTQRSEMPVAGCGTCGDPRGPGSCSIN